MPAFDPDTYGHWTLRLLGLAVAGAAVVALGVLGWQWRASRTVGVVTVTGAQHAPPDTLRRLARVDSGATLRSVDAALVADRVVRHPWVRTADITKQHAWRTLHIHVAERTPAALALGPDGRPAYYLDAHGYAMPCPNCAEHMTYGARPDSTSHDVPLVRGLDAEAYHPVRRVAPPRLRAVLSALDGSDAAPLAAELAVRPDSSVGLVTTPIGEHGALPVRLGAGAPRPQLRQLRAFATQVLSRPPSEPERPIAAIDLRFDGQIVARTRPADPS